MLKRIDLLAGDTSILDLDIPIPLALREALAASRNYVKTLVVGGSVRDALLGFKPKDVDIEVYGATYDDLVEILRPHGRVSIVGQAFGVLLFNGPDGSSIDVSIPRREKKNWNWASRLYHDL